MCENYHRLFDGRTRFESGVLKIRGKKRCLPQLDQYTDTLLVLPPIPTTGLTVDDVTTVAESTRESMLHALREISEPGPSSSLSTSSATPLAPPIPEHITQPPAGAPIQLDISDSIALRQRGANFSSISSGVSSEWSESERKFEEKSEETTEDEMDEDAVLLKKPKESVA